ncbi:unnamed protein product [Rotaria socialis]|uniref:Innexin n=1 Tax=Rotaria socialis TaxID=392032 RepID=A0A820MJ74_9BILA|nr:unnamed protein product [Rotaria socialis]CAF4373372.1 unnamed protein product [Rotaria socialis]
MASLFKNALEQVGQSQKIDDDIIDRFNHRFTVIILVTFTAFVSAKQFIGDPISCWAPSHFSASQIAYTNSICWLKGTYYLDVYSHLIPHRTQNSEFRIAYYQYIPYILLIMALFFYLPHIVWRNISRRIGFDLRSIIQNVKQVLNTNMNQVTLQIHIALVYNSSKYVVGDNKTRRRLFDILQSTRGHRCHLTLLYIFVKTLYMVNCLFQFYFLSAILSFPFHTFGIEWLSTIFRKVHSRVNTEPNESKWFPRVVMCDFMVRHLGSNQHWMAIQCNLPINLFNEIIFLILWAWYILLSSLTCVSLIFCLCLMYSNIGCTFIHKYLHMNSPKSSKEQCDNFIGNYLKWDGILVLRLIAHNTNDIIMANLVGALFKMYLDSNEKQNDQVRLNEHYERVDVSSD